MLNIFDGDAFSVVSLTDAINNIKFVPGRIGSMGLFRATPISTLTAVIETKGGILTLVEPTPRGGPGQTVGTSRADLRAIPVPHFQLDDAIYADAVQGVRAFGSETMLETVVGVTTERMAILTQSLDATEEYARIGAVKGLVTYAGGTSLDLFTFFGVTQMDEIDFDLDNANPAEGILRRKCAGVIRSVGGELDGLPFAGVHALCGNAFFDDLIAHPEVRETYLNQVAASELRSGYLQTGQQSWGSFTFGDIRFENYRGAVGATNFVHTDKCHFYPIGVPGLFRTYYAPADYEDTVNTLGRARYAKQWPMPNGKGRNLEAQTNSLNICTRPRTLILAKRT
jgi:hypothetical protein